MKWSRPKWIGQVQIVIHFGRKLQFGPDQFILVMTISFWSWPNHYGQVQTNLVRQKPFWTNQNCFGPIEGQGIKKLMVMIVTFHFEPLLVVLCRKSYRLKQITQILVCNEYQRNATYREENVRKRKKNVLFGRKRSVKRGKNAIKGEEGVRKRKKNVLFGRERPSLSR